jgi:hypothetical protein
MKYQNIWLQCYKWWCVPTGLLLAQNCYITPFYPSELTVGMQALVLKLQKFKLVSLEILSGHSHILRHPFTSLMCNLSVVRNNFVWMYMCLHLVMNTSIQDFCNSKFRAGKMKLMVVLCNFSKGEILRSEHPEWTQPPIQWVPGGSFPGGKANTRGLGLEADHSPPASA